MMQAQIDKNPAYNNVDDPVYVSLIHHYLYGTKRRQCHPIFGLILWRKHKAEAYNIGELNFINEIKSNTANYLPGHTARNKHCGKFKLTPDYLMVTQDNWIVNFAINLNFKGIFTKAI